MKKIKLVNFLLIFFILIPNIQTCFCQDLDKLKIEYNSKFNYPNYVSSVGSNYEISHYPTIEDSIIILKYDSLINSEPNKTNYCNYYFLACALWNLSRLEEAENLFLKIVNSEEDFYTQSYLNSSDIPLDSIGNIYQYGSLLWNYKNYACLYLSKIYIEQKKFEKAINFIDLASKKYEIKYNCGTGNMLYVGEINGLFSLAYEGLEMYDSIINLFIPNFKEYKNDRLIRAIKKLYSKPEIIKFLTDAENSITCDDDTYQIFDFLYQDHNYENDTITKVKFVSGHAKMILFGRQVFLPGIFVNEGKNVTKNDFIRDFRESEFYKALINY